ncbi:MAG: recombinase family protein [Pseudomonadota bacterium]
MPRRSHRHAESDPLKAVGYILAGHRPQGGANTDLRAWASIHGVELLQVCGDECPPDTPLNLRPGFAEALCALWDTGAGVLLVEGVAALALDPPHRAMAAVILDTHGSRLVSTDPGEEHILDTLAPMMEAFVVFYDLDRRVRVSAGLATLKRRRRLVSRVAPYGWMTTDDDPKTLVPNPAERVVIRLAQELRAEGLPLRKIGQRLTELGHHPRRGGPWQPQTIANLLTKTPEDGS